MPFEFAPTIDEESFIRIEDDLKSMSTPLDSWPRHDEKEKFSEFLEGLNKRKSLLTAAEGQYGLHSQDQDMVVVRQELLEALGGLVIPEKLTEEESSQFQKVLINYKSALDHWQNGLIDRLYDREGKERIADLAT
jgi:hypothetical protein